MQFHSINLRVIAVLPITLTISVLPLVISDSNSVLPIARHDISKHANWLTQVKSKNSRPNEVCFMKLGYLHGALSNSQVSEAKRP